MTDSELQEAQARLNDLDTLAADLRRAVDEGIQAARSINAQVRVAQAKLRATEEQTNALRQELKVELNARATRTE